MFIKDYAQRITSRRTPRNYLSTIRHFLCDLIRTIILYALATTIALYILLFWIGGIL
jgi:hypothetical protein